MSDSEMKATSETCSDILSRYKLESATYTGSYGTCVDLYADLKPKESTSTEENASTSDRSSLLNINDLPLPMNNSETSIIQSAAFIEDGIHHRSIHHKIDPTSLTIYRIYYSRPVRWLLGFVIFINLMLSFFEYPSSMSLSSDYRFRDITWHWPEPGCGVTEGIEIVCLLVFLIDCYAKFYLLGWRRFVRRPWFVLYAVMVIISFVDIIVSLSFCEHRGSFPLSLGYTLRIRRFFRPLFFIISSSIMKKFAKAAVKTLPQIFTVLFLLALHIYVFAMFGLLVFPREPPINGTNETGYTPSGHSIPFENTSSSSLITNYSHYEHLESQKYFKNIFDALTSLLVLLTTANHPDVMIPIYQFNRFSSLYFILFLGLGAFIILNLLIAVTYNQFRGFFLKSLTSSLRRRRVAFRAAFTILANETRKSRRPSNNELVSRDLVRRLLRKMHLSSKKISLMFTKLETTGTGTVNWQQFRDIFDAAQDLHETRDPSNESESEYYTTFRPFHWFQLGIRHRFFNYFTYVISVINVLLVTIELEIAYDESFTRADSRLAYYNLFFVIYYTVEQVLKLIGYGCRRYFKSIGNWYEGLITCALIFLEFLVLVLYDSPKHSHDPLVDIYYLNIIIRLMNIFIVLRLLRILVQVSYLRLLTSTMVDLIWNVRGFFGIIIVVYYLFAFLGMELFDDVDGPSQGCDPAPDYDKLLYFGNNFHDFASSLVTLWDVMVVNNWFIFLDKFACDSRFGLWAKLYFIAWWLVSAIICMNLFISLVLEIFLIKWEVWQKRNLGALDESGDQTGSSGEGSQISNINNLLRSNLEEPDDADVMRELQKHKDIMLYEY